MRRPGWVWIALAASLAVLAGVVGWLSVTVLRLERAEARAREQSLAEENVRLALWRMDSALAPLLARESARPYFVYSAFYPAERAYTRRLSEIERGEVLIPSPLLAGAPYVRLHFQIDAGGTFTSPQAPDDAFLALATPRYVTEAAVMTSRERLGELQATLDRQRLLALLPADDANDAARVVLQPARSPVGNDGPWQQQLAQQAPRNERETQARNRLNLDNRQVRASTTPEAARWTGAAEGAIRPLWIDGKLLLARRVQLGDELYVQGCWLDWDAIQAWLRGEVTDLFARVDFEPLPAGAVRGAGHALATLPVRLRAAVLAETLPPAQTTLQYSLYIAWLGALVAAAAVAALLVGAVVLSERRAAFVSAVTHELRTPLTTFRLYTDLLLGGQITERDKIGQYLGTLHAEALRLAHLVDNVLAYARLEHGRARRRTEALPLVDLLEGAKDRLAERGGQVGMVVCCAPPPAELAGLTVHAARGEVEQILLNLVDNSCKYASAGATNVIRLSLSRENEFAVIRVCDDGPGVPAHERARLFRPFHKSSQDAAHTKPGVGLGLALSRRLARSLGGELRCGETKTGACFELLLRVGGVEPNKPQRSR